MAKKKKAGRPQGEETTIINFRIAVAKKAKLNKRYGKKLPPMFHEWSNSILKTKP